MKYTKRTEDTDRQTHRRKKRYSRYSSEVVVRWETLFKCVVTVSVAHPDVQIVRCHHLRKEELGKFL